MAESSPPGSLTFQGSLIQLKKKLISTSGNSIVIRMGTDANIIREMQIFPKSKIRFLLPIGEKSGENVFFLAISSKRIALFHLKKKTPIAIFKFDEQIVDHGMVDVLTMGRKKEEEGAEFRVRLTIPLAFRSGSLRKMRLTVHFLESQVIKQKMKCLEELIIDDHQKLQSCVDLGNNNVFGFYEDTVVKSDGMVTRAGEPSTKKKRRISVVAKELWHGNILMATENGSIRVVRVKEMNKKSDSLSIFSEGQCVPPYCTLRCRQPSVIISTKNAVIVGTREGEIHCLNARLELVRKFDSESAPISCLKIDENDSDFLWLRFEKGELRRIYEIASEHNGVMAKVIVLSSESLTHVEQEERCNGEGKKSIKKSKRDYGPFAYGGGSILDSWSIGRSAKRSETEMECLEKGCYFKARVASTFITHLRRAHRTTLVLAGLALRCECGVDAISNKHNRVCNVSNFTVVRKEGFGPIRTFADRMTPQCTLCKVYPRSVYGYSFHLYEEHNKTLDEIKCYLKCGVCRSDVYTRYESCEHSKKCKSRFYSLLKLGEEAEKKNETEMDQNVEGQNMDETWSLAPLLLMDENNRDEKKVKQEYESVL